MNNQLDILKSLIDKLDLYTNEVKDGLIDERRFISWLYEKNILESSQSITHDEEIHLDGEIVYYIDSLNKRYKEFTHDALSDSEIKTPDEYSFLLHLEHAGSLRKLEIIKMHLLKTPSGIEIIKRLLIKGLIVEFPDKDDARAKRIKNTEKGSKTLQQVHNAMMEVFSGMTGDLSLEEKMRLNDILKALNSFHAQDDV